jgi:hypothetical protein
MCQAFGKRSFRAIIKLVSIAGLFRVPRISRIFAFNVNTTYYMHYYYVQNV